MTRDFAHQSDRDALLYGRTRLLPSQQHLGLRVRNQTNPQKDPPSPREPRPEA